VIGFYNSSNVAVSYFINSTGQAVLLSNMTGDVHVNNSTFTANNKYSDHGAAIHYSSGSTVWPLMVIDNCHFTLNEPASSVVFIQGKNSQPRPVTVENSAFSQNQGVPIHVSQTSLLINGTISFQQNKALHGGGIFSTGSTVTFNDNSKIYFDSNTANINGGAICLHSSIVVIGLNLSIQFKNNNALRGGGAIFSNTPLILKFSDTLVNFENNVADYGGLTSRASSIQILIFRNSSV